MITPISATAAIRAARLTLLGSVTLLWVTE